MKNKRTFTGLLLMPIAYVVAAFFLDFLLFFIIAIPFPQHWFTSFLLLLILALLISCIPNRIAQFCVFMFFIAWQTVTTVANLIAYNNLGEIFILETLRSFREIVAGAGAARYDGTWHYFLVAFIVLSFIGVSIFAMIKYKKQRAGYPMRSVVAVATALIVFSGSIAIYMISIRKDNQSNFDKLIDPYHSFMSFTNRSRALYSFGQPMFYFRNTLSILGMKTIGNVDATGESLGWSRTVSDSEYEYILDRDYNLIMLMMETIEFDAIDPILTPNLYEIKNMSTWVDGYYATERTAFTEYLSLAGNHAMGVEMWRDYKHIDQVNSLPNIFRRAWEADMQSGGPDFVIGGFHTYNHEFYNRDIMFTPSRNGADFIRDMSYYNLEIDFDFSSNSDVAFFQAAIEDIAPSDGKRFLSYVLNVSTHAPHFNAAFMTRCLETNQFESMYQDSLEYILENKDYFLYTFDKLGSPDEAVVDAVMAFLVSIKEYDTAVGVIMNHLRETGLIENTALVFYSDHFNYIAYQNRFNPQGGGLLSNNNIESPIGEKCVFMLFNPRDTYARDKGRRIESFMAKTDIYKTITHLFGIETHRDFTLGSSVLSRIDNDEYDISAGIGFVNGLFYGTDINDPTLHWSTRDFRRFTTNKEGYYPSAETLVAYRARLNDYANVILRTRGHFDNDSFGRAGIIYNLP